MHDVTAISIQCAAATTGRSRNAHDGWAVGPAWLQFILSNM